MLRPVVFLLAAALLAACSPALNWREIRVAGGELKALLPCKPDHAVRTQALGAQALRISMQGCEAAGGLYAVSVAELPEAGSADAVRTQWEAALLANMHATTSARQPARVAGHTDGFAPVLLTAQGAAPDGTPVTAQAVWFARGNRLYHAAIYGRRISADMSEPFFGALELP